MSKQELIDDIMDNFDFHKVAAVMDFLDWKWGLVDGFRVPIEPEIRGKVRGQLNKVYDYGQGQGRKYTMGTGGFSYSYDPQHNDLSLVFEIASWDAYPAEQGVPF
jgi:hypothetical protein